MKKEKYSMYNVFAMKAWEDHELQKGPVDSARLPGY